MNYYVRLTIALVIALTVLLFFMSTLIRFTARNYGPSEIVNFLSWALIVESACIFLSFLFYSVAVSDYLVAIGAFVHGIGVNHLNKKR